MLNADYQKKQMLITCASMAIVYRRLPQGLHTAPYVHERRIGTFPMHVISVFGQTAFHDRREFTVELTWECAHDILHFFMFHGVLFFCLESNDLFSILTPNCSVTFLN